jgi:citrate lyase beta subunit
VSADLRKLADDLDLGLADTDADLARRYPGDPGTRQPVHTVYIPAHRYHPGITRAWGAEALALFDQHAADAEALTEVTGMPVELASQVLPLVRAKLEREPIEDVRIDFEDGFGEQGEEAEDAAAVAASRALAAASDVGSATPFQGIRFKSLEPQSRRRGLRTLDQFVGTLAARGGLPDGFVVTLPKVTAVAQVAAMVQVCEYLEATYGLGDGRLRFEIQIETAQSILLPDGTAAVARMIAAAQGRCVGLHYGTYDYSAACGIAPQYQSMEHPAADHAKAVMQVAAAGTGVRLSDGSTNALPVGDGASIRAAWQLHARLVRRSLQRGYYQGWDLHPGQLVTRYATTFAFYREGFGPAAERLRAYLAEDASGFLDEPATARALAWFIRRGLQCGAIGSQELGQRTGLTPETLKSLAHPGRPLAPVGIGAGNNS